VQASPVDAETASAYLQRMALTADVAADAAGLATLHHAHQLSVPFENLRSVVNSDSSPRTTVGRRTGVP